MKGILARLDGVLGDQVARRFLGDAGLALALRVIWALVNYAVVLLFTLWMLPVEYGRFAIVLSILRPASIMAGLGADTSILRFIGQYEAEGRHGAIRAVIDYALKATTLASIVVTLVLIAAFWSLAAFGPFEAPMVYTIGALLVPFYTISGVLGAIARSFGHIVLALAPRDVFWRGVLIPIGWLVIFQFVAEEQASWILGLAVLAIALIVAIQFVWVRLRLPQLVKDAPPQSDRADWHAVSRPLWLNAVTIGIMANADVLIVGAFVDEIAAGRYFSVQRTAMLVTFMQISANLIIGPAAARLYHERKFAELQRLLTIAAVVTFIPSFGALLVFGLFGSYMLDFFGPDFASYRYELLLLSSGQAVAASVGCVGILLAMVGHERFLARMQIIATSLTLLAVVVLTSMYGTLGAAIGTTAGITIRNIVIWAYSRRTLPLEASILAVFRRPKQAD